MENKQDKQIEILKLKIELAKLLIELEKVKHIEYWKPMLVIGQDVKFPNLK
jgi:hypothetical protein